MGEHIFRSTRINWRLCVTRRMCVCVCVTVWVGGWLDWWTVGYCFSLLFVWFICLSCPPDSWHSFLHTEPWGCCSGSSKEFGNVEWKSSQKTIAMATISKCQTKHRRCQTNLLGVTTQELHLQNTRMGRVSKWKMGQFFKPCIWWLERLLFVLLGKQRKTGRAEENVGRGTERRGRRGSCLHVLHHWREECNRSEGKTQWMTCETWMDGE